ncbi:MAG: site-specific integrase [Archaeoglobi archaeon]|nr:site-specific integrase [Candidatus Mnemosynella bozhongmuii]
MQNSLHPILIEAPDDPKYKERKPERKRPFRILRPLEYEMLKQGARSKENRLNLDVLLLTGLRYEEARRLQEHPEWFDGNFIRIPEMKKKRKRRQRQRWVRLSLMGKTVLPFFFENKPLPDPHVWMENLIRWARRASLDPAGLGAKTTRKTWESWLVFCYPERQIEIIQSQGHTLLTAIQHYTNMPFTEDDRRRMEKYVHGW